jgi:hypothetical protein
MQKGKDSAECEMERTALSASRIGQRLVQKEQDSAQFREDRTVLSEKC